MMSFLHQADLFVFFWINHHNTPLLDVFFWYVSNKYVWIPFYLFLLWLLFKKHKQEAWIFVVTGVLLIAATDQMSVHLFKEVFQRNRPCHNEHIKMFVHLYQGKCGGQFGFISSHAANASALAMYLWLVLQPVVQKKQTLTFVLSLYVLLIMYSRVYLGQHYPSDVLAGAFFGLLCGWGAYRLALLVKKTKLR